MNYAKRKMGYMMTRAYMACNDARERVIKAVSNDNGEGYLDTVMKILIAVVLGALLLAGLYAIFKDTLMPMLKDKIIDTFNYS